MDCTGSASGCDVGILIHFTRPSSDTHLTNVMRECFFRQSWVSPSMAVRNGKGIAHVWRLSFSAVELFIFMAVSNSTETVYENILALPVVIWQQLFMRLVGNNVKDDPNLSGKQFEEYPREVVLFERFSNISTCRYKWGLGLPYVVSLQNIPKRKVQNGAF